MRAAAPGQPILCVVTDRRRAFAADETAAALDCLVAQARRAAAASIDIIHVRERYLDAAVLVDLVGRIAAAVAGSATKVVVNERVDVAIAAGAHGVHLRGDSVPAARVREIAPTPFIIGRSVHSAADAREHAASVDYLVAGTTFPTVSKPGAVLLGVEGLAAIASEVAVPVLAIGGISLGNAAAVARAGAAGLAAIGLFLDETATGPCRARSLDPVVAAVRREFARGVAA